MMSTRDAISINYFSCTLGEASLLKGPFEPQFKTISGLIKQQAIEHKDDYAVGFPVPSPEGNGWSTTVLTFNELHKCSLLTNRQSMFIRKETGTSKTVALLCPSSIDFLVSWLRLLGVGLTVLIIAPQCQPDAIVHLCKSCDVELLLYHEQYFKLAESSTKLWEDLRILEIRHAFECERKHYGPDLGALSLDPREEENDIAYIFHSSGTSQGFPKPIPQTHLASVGVLPCFDGQEIATFSTTPLYHGGIADCLRAWSSSAMIWLFPGRDLPITTSNIYKCLLAAQEMNSTCSAVKYFSSVPYILHLLSEEAQGISMLKTMELVGVGGAALSPEIGNQLVRHGVKLLSRFGSAECGFLLSSHRDYSRDTDWQYLRRHPNVNELTFENQNDGSGLFELIVCSGWPCMSMSNRKDGSFATNDLFEPHPSVENAWRYHSRSDSQITLLTGKKFDPASLEEKIISKSCASDVLVFGDGRQVPGILAFRSPNTDSTDDEFETQVWGAIQKLNGNLQNHMRISREMLVPMPLNSQTLQKSSKGTRLRKIAEKTFSIEIEKAYSSLSGKIVPGGNGNVHLTEDELKLFLHEVIGSCLGTEPTLTDNSDFYQSGIDSAQSSLLVSRIRKKLGFPLRALQINDFYDCGNISKLAMFLSNQSGGRRDRESRLHEMEVLVKSLSNFAKPEKKRKIVSLGAPSIVVLTGATGSLGVHILDSLRRDNSVSHIFCLVRAATSKDATKRVSNNLLKRQKKPLQKGNTRITCLPCQLEEVDLGLSTDVLNYIEENATHIIHAAWAVNFSLPLGSFVQTHLQGLHHLLNITIRSTNAKMVFCSSTASVLAAKQSHLIKELVSLDPKDCDNLGYSQSKWVAENICYAASQTSGMEGRVRVLRVGQLTGDSNTGIWNMSEAWPLMWAASLELGCLPRLNQVLDWLPLDIAAEAVVEIAFSKDFSPSGSFFYHILNTDTNSTWQNMLDWTKVEEITEIVSLRTWLDKLGALETHPAKSLVWLWEKMIDTVGDSRKISQNASISVFETTNAARTSQSLRCVKPVDQTLTERIWDWIRMEVHRC